jgi:hypothetical protein
MSGIIHTLQKYQLKPRDEWKRETKELLLARIAADTANEPSRGVFSFLRDFQVFLPEQLFLNLSSRLAFVMVIILGGYVVTVFAAGNSLPGDTLYGVKRADEEMRKAMYTLVQEEKVGELELSFAKRRLDEAEKIAAGVGDHAMKQEKVKAAMAEVKTHIEKASNEMANLSNKGKVQQAVALAEKVETESKSISQSLDEKQERIVALTPKEEPTVGAANAEVQKAIDTTSKSADNAVLEAVNVIIDQYVSGNTLLSTDEIKGKIAEKIKEVTEKSNDAEESGKKENSEEGSDGSETNGNDSSEPPIIDEYLVKTQIANKLKEARELLENGTIATSFRRVQEANELVDTLNLGKEATSESSVTSESNENESETINSTVIKSEVSTSNTSEVDNTAGGSAPFEPLQKE